MAPDVDRSETQGTPKGVDLVRDDPWGTLTAQLQREIDVAHRLVEGVERITDDASFERWREQFDPWRSHCGDTLRERFAPEVAEEFYGGTEIASAARDQWQQGQQAAEKAIKDMIQLLVTLRRTLAARGTAAT